MSVSGSCKLCLNSWSDCETLVDEKGNKTEKYRIVHKYFERKFLDEKQRQHLRKICLICWRQINDFYHFQKFILRSETKLRDEASNVKTENELKRKRNSEKENIDENRRVEMEPETKRSQHGTSSTIKSIKKESVDPIKSEPLQHKDFEIDDMDLSFSELDSIDIQFSSDEDKSIAESEECANISKILAKNPLFQDIKSDDKSVPAYEVVNAIKSNLDSLRKQLASTEAEAEKVLLRTQIEENLSILRERRKRRENNENISVIGAAELDNISKVLAKNSKFESNKISIPTSDFVKSIKRNVDSLRQQLQSAKTEADKTLLNQQIEENLNVLRERKRRHQRNNRRNRRLRRLMEGKRDYRDSYKYRNTYRSK